MRTPSLRMTLILLAAGMGLLPGGSLGAAAQEVDRVVKEAYFRTVGEHFGLPLGEVVLIGEWELTPDEVPVVLFLAQRAGVSSDALIGLRRGGRGWMEVATRFGLGAQAFHLSLPEDAPPGVLSRALQEFRDTPVREWSRIRLQDQEIVALINLRVLSQAVGVTPLQVLRCREDAGSFVACYPRLRGR